METVEAAPTNRNHLVAAIAAGQHGVISRAQLLGISLESSSISGRVRAGTLHTIHPGVYAVGHRSLSREGHMHAALLAVGPGIAAIGRRTALELHGIWRSTTRDIDVVTPRRSRGKRGVSIWPVRPFHSEDLQIVDGLMVTTVHRTCIDLALEMDPSALCNVMFEAHRRRRLYVRGLERAIARHRTNHGHPVLREAFEMFQAGSAGSRSSLERRFRSVLRAYGIPMPEQNVGISLDGDWFELDFVWSAHKFAVELDGSPHRLLRVKRDDLARDRAYDASEFRWMRVTGDELDRDELATANAIRGALGMCPVDAPLPRFMSDPG